MLMEEKILSILKEQVEKMGIEFVFNESSGSLNHSYLMKDLDVLMSVSCHLGKDSMFFNFYPNDLEDFRFVGFLQSKPMKFIKIQYNKNLKNGIEEVKTYIENFVYEKFSYLFKEELINNIENGVEINQGEKEEEEEVAS
jgi:hypothetical protein